jgi:hypothetical protein
MPLEGNESAFEGRAPPVGGRLSFIESERQSHGGKASFFA